MKLVKRIAGTFVVRAASAGGSLLFAAAIIQLYSLEKFGQFALALATVRLLGVAGMFSLDSLLLRLLLRLQSRGATHLYPRLITQCSGFALVISGVVLIVLAMVALGGVLVGDEQPFWISLLLLSPLVLGQNIANIQSAWLRLERRDLESQLVVVGIPIVLPLILVAGLFLLPNRPDNLPEIAMVAGMAAAILYGWLQTGIAPQRGLRTGLSNFTERRLRVLRYSSAVHSANVMNFFTEWYAGFITAVTQSFEVVGVLRVFQQFGKAVHLVSHSVELPFATEIANAHIRRDPDEIHRRLVQSQMILGAAGVGLVLAIFIAKDLIFAMYELDSGAISFAFYLYISLVAARLLGGASASALNIMDTTPQLLKASRISIVVGVALLSAMVPFFGLLGAAIALGLQVVTQAAINYYFVLTVLRAERRKAAAKET